MNTPTTAEQRERVPATGVATIDLRDRLVTDVRTVRATPGQRTLDVVGAVVVLVIASPILILVGLAIRLTSTGPILYRDPRLGSGGSVLRILKFRTMHVDAAERLSGLLTADADAHAEYVATFKLRRDPRTMFLGRLLRRASLDELPQLLNVLSGSMSLVGPRPKLLSEIDAFGVENLREVLAVRPGMTGLWQVSGRNRLSYEERVELDVQYVRKRSLLMDFWILVRTPLALVRSVFDGAY